MMGTLTLRSFTCLTVADLLLAASCSSGTTDTTATTIAAVATSTSSIATSTTTTSQPPETTTTTTTAATTTTVAPTTTTVACPDFPRIAMSQSGADEDLEPGSYVVSWVLPKFTFTVSEPTQVWLGERFDNFGWGPIPDPAWQHPDLSYEALEFTTFDYLVSYDGESNVDLPEDPGAWLTEHPLLETGEAVTVMIDGYEGVQVDAVVVGSHPGTGDSVRFGGYANLRGQRWLPQGAAVRIVFVEVDDEPLWPILTATEDGFDDAATWSDTIIAGIDFC